MRFLSAGVILFLAASPAMAQWTPTGGGDHGGSDWTLVNGDSIAGVHTNIGDFVVPAGATVTIEPYDGANFGSVEIHAMTIDVQGTLDGTGAGFRGLGGVNGEGGASGGTIGTGADGGGAGGGHGGAGGDGADGNAGTGGIGGAASGSPTAAANEMGGAGGAGRSGTTCGLPGSGGAAITLLACTTMTISGSVVSHGTNGISDCNVIVGGGGAGGGIVLQGGNVTVSGTVSANGGTITGGCTATDDGGGGGGGGGRIKIFYTTINTAGSTMTQTGGAGNCCSSADPCGIDGTDGSYNESNTQPFTVNVPATCGGGGSGGGGIIPTGRDNDNGDEDWWRDLCAIGNSTRAGWPAVLLLFAFVLPWLIRRTRA